MEFVTYIFKVLLFLIVFSAIAFLAFTGTRLLGRKMSKGMRGKAMQVVESINLGIDKQLHLVKIGNRFFMIPSSGKNLGEMKEIELDSATIEKMAEAESEGQDLLKFEDEFRNIWNKLINVTKLDSRIKALNKTTGNKAEPAVYKKSGGLEKQVSSYGYAGQDSFQKNLDRLKKLTQDKMIQ